MAGLQSVLGRTLGHYRILEQIGAGGMGVVYRARDERLERDVAVKVLPPGTLADESARERFRKEALALSRLNHPNIATVFDFDSQDGTDFLVTELIPGATLDEKLAAGPLPEKEALQIGQQLADGLMAAHQQGVIHRDLKPGNLRLTPEGRLKILDFGLAKRVDAADQLSVTHSELEAGPAGTLAYMAPEQLKGDKVDVRSDVWGAGVVLFELATGRRPFEGNTATVLTDGILHRAVPVDEAGRLSERLAEIILKCLEKDPENRYQSAKELLIDLRRLATSSAVAVVAVPRRRRWRRLAPIAAIAIIGVAALVYVGVRARLRGPAKGKIASIAVLPLVNLSPDAAQEYFADGMTEALITKLSKIRALKVIARSSVMRYKNAAKPARDIARELGVDGIVEGSVQRSGGRVRVAAQLISAADDSNIWADSYERDMEDVLRLQGELAQVIASQIRVVTTPEEKRRLASSPRVNPEAYTAYLTGRFHWEKLSREGLDTAEQYYQLALRKQPDFALAYDGLAAVWYSRGDTGLIPPEEAYAKSKKFGMKALQLDDSLPDPHTQLGNIKFAYEWDPAGAEREFRRAIELDPNAAHFSYSDLLVSTGRGREGEAEMRRFLELDPLSYMGHCFYGWHLVYAGRYDEALAELNKTMAMQPELSSVHLGLWGAYYKKRMWDQALAEANKFFDIIDQPEIAEVLVGSGGEPHYRRVMLIAAERMIERSKRTHTPATRVARLYAHAGDKERALKWLERAYQQHETALIHARVFWDWDLLRDDPRFQDLLRRVHLVN